MDSGRLADILPDRTWVPYLTRTAQDISTVGGRIRKLRIDAQMTQADLVELLHMENKTTISKYESNQRMPAAEHVVRMARIFHTTTDYILIGELPEKSSRIVHAENLLRKLEAVGMLEAAIPVLESLHGALDIR